MALPSRPDGTGEPSYIHFRNFTLAIVRAMPIVYIPSLLRDLTDGQERVIVPGKTVQEVITALERTHAGIQTRLCDENGLRSGIALIVDAEVSRQGLRHPLGEKSEVHFLPAVSGG
jgi:molybdopterin synthase sulfur carrier subunit